MAAAESATQPEEHRGHPGQVFGEFELIEEVGRGGMGVIYRARQVGLNRNVALKMLVAGEFADDKARSRLLREARVAAQLAHPGIVTIFEVGEHGGQPYFAMEYVAGRNLAEICREGMLPARKAATYLEQVARAVAYAHEHGVIHRDLKPANVLIDNLDRAKLTDFGLTKSMIDPTRTFESAGSPNFMAPEQADSRLGATGAATDVFGLGAILYYALTGRPPATGETLAETLIAVVEREPLAPEELRPGLSRDLATIALRCLEKEPKRRYQTAEEVANELSRWLKDEPIQARRSSLPERAWKWGRRHPLTASLVVAIVVLMAGGSTTTTWQWRRAAASEQAARISASAARRNAYLAEMTVANQAAINGRWDEVRMSLHRTRPKPGEEDFRGWEWRYLWKASLSEARGRFAERRNRIISMAVLDDRTVALGETQGGFSVWDVVSGDLIFETTEPINGYNTGVAGSVVGCRLAAIAGTTLLAYTDCNSPTNGQVRLFDIVTKTVSASFAVPGVPRHLAASADGRMIACSTMRPDSRVYVIEIAGGKVVREIKADFGYSGGSSLTFSPDGRMVTVAEKSSVRLVEIGSGRDADRFEVGGDWVLSCAFSPDGKWFAAGSGFSRHDLNVWDLRDKTLRATLPEASPLSVRFDGTSARLYSGLNVWRVPEFTLERRLTGEDPWSHATALMPDGKTYLTESPPASVLKWDLARPGAARAGHRLEPQNSIAFLGGERGLVYTGTNGLAYEARPPAFENKVLQKAGTNLLSVAYTEWIDALVFGDQDGLVTVRKLPELAESRRFVTGRGAPHWMWAVDQSRTVAIGTGREFLQVWDPARGELQWESKVPEWGNNFCFSEFDSVVCVYYPDGRLIILDLMNRRVTEGQLDHQDVHNLAYSPDGKWMLSGSPNGQKRLIDAKTLKTASVLGSIRGGIHGSVFWPGEARLALSGVQIIDLESERQVLTLARETGLGGPLRVSKDGSTLTQIDYDNVVYVWWAPSWKLIHEFESRPDETSWW